MRRYPKALAEAQNKIAAIRKAAGGTGILHRDPHPQKLFRFGKALGLNIVGGRHLEILLELSAQRVRIPTRDCIRSLNLSTSAGIVLYFALAGIGALEGWE